MMKGLLVAALLIINLTATAQKTYTVVQDAQLKQPIYNGLVTFEDLNKEPAFDWLKKGVEAYKPDHKTVAYLQAMLPQYTMVVFLGTWCSDSHNLVPKFRKVMEETGYPEKDVTLYCVDMEKKTTGGEQTQYHIEYVPTFILYKNGKEAGRIVESTRTSIEAELATIIEKNSGAAIPH